MIQKKSNWQKDILITGGLGFIGSHTAVELLLNLENRIVILDNLANSHKETFEKIKNVVGDDSNGEPGREPERDTLSDRLFFEEGDLCDPLFLEKVFQTYDFEGVIHFAGLKAVSESVREPLKYYRTNLVFTLNLLETMQRHEVHNLIFSSSATVYGNSVSPLLEIASEVGHGITNPYGETKYMIESFLQSLHRSDTSWQITILRYFNPIGAHPSGKLGEDPLDTPNNLMPWILRAAIADNKTDKRAQLTVFGNDYDTEDGTCIRDYVHVVDIARAHRVAMARATSAPNLVVYNLGTGRGTSVLQLIRAFEKANSIKVDWKFGERRNGDLGVCYCDPSLIETQLGWKAEKTLEDMCKDAWSFYKNC